MTAVAAAGRPSSLDAVRRLFRDRPVVPLTGLLVLLVLVMAIASPGIVTPSWAGVILRTAVPLAILAGCQTLTMLTGGIDLSVGAVASMAGFVTATLIHSPGGVVQGIAVALAVAALAGLINGIGVGVFKVHPLIVTLGMSFIVLGFANVWQLQSVQTGAGVPDILRTIGSGRAFDVIPNSLVVFVPVALLILLVLTAHRVRPPAVRDRRQPGRGPALRRPLVAGPDRALRHQRPARRDRRPRAQRRDQHRQRQPRGLARPARGRRRRHRRDVDPRRSRAATAARSSVR